MGSDALKITGIVLLMTFVAISLDLITNNSFGPTGLDTVQTLSLVRGWVFDSGGNPVANVSVYVFANDSGTIYRSQGAVKTIATGGFAETISNMYEWNGTHVDLGNQIGNLNSAQDYLWMEGDGTTATPSPVSNTSTSPVLIDLLPHTTGFWTIYLANVTAYAETTPPNVTLVAPANNSEWNTSYNVVLTYNVTDNSTVSNCTLIINGTVNQTNTSITKDINQTFTVFLYNGTYSWKVNCTDIGGFEGESETWLINVSVPDSPPNVTYQEPTAGYYNDTSDPVNVNFRCNTTDDLGLDNISLYITNNQNQSFSLNDTKAISGTSDSETWTLSLSNGNYTWNCLAYDIIGQSDWGENRTILVNNTNNLPTAPVINVTPENATTVQDLLCEITVNSTDADNETVSYYFQWYNSSTLILTLGPTNDTQHILGAGNTTKHDMWNCSVIPTDGIDNGTAGWDNATIINSPPVNSFSVPDRSWLINENETLPNNLSYYFSDADNDNLTFTYLDPDNITVDILSNGTVVFDPAENWTGVNYIVFYANDSEAVTPSNNATLTVTSCGNSVIDAGEECDGSNFGGKTCSDYGHTSGSLSCTGSCTIDSSGCSTPGGGGGGGGRTYECSDKIDNDGDGLIDYPDDPGCTAYSDNSEVDEICVIEWDCTEWGICENGEQTRTCVYTGTCTDQGEKPDTVRLCEAKGIDIEIIEYPENISINEDFTVIAEVRNTGGQILKDVVVKDESTEEWRVKDIELGDIGIGESVTIRAEFASRMCSNSYVVIMPDFNIVLRAEERDVSDSDNKTAGIYVPRLSVMTDKKRYSEGDMMRTCIILSNIDGEETDSNVEFELEVSSDSTDYIIDYLSSYALDPGKVLVVVKRYTLNYIPFPHDYFVKVKMFCDGVLFSERYEEANASTTIFLNGMTEEKILIEEGESFGFEYSQEDHAIILEKLDENYVIVSVESEPQKFNIRFLETDYADLDLDATDDISLTYLGLVRDKADLRLRFLPRHIISRDIEESYIIGEGEKTPVIREPTIVLTRTEYSIWKQFISSVTFRFILLLMFITGLILVIRYSTEGFYRITSYPDMKHYGQAIIRRFGILPKKHDVKKKEGIKKVCFAGAKRVTPHVIGKRVEILSKQMIKQEREKNILGKTAVQRRMTKVFSKAKNGIRRILSKTKRFAAREMGGVSKKVTKKQAEQVKQLKKKVAEDMKDVYKKK